MQIKFLKLSDRAKIPTKATNYAAGFDIASAERYELAPGESHLFKTGLSSSIDEGYCVVLFDRSGMGAKKNIHRLAGVIDSDYRGEWGVCLINLSKNAHIINEGDNIIQGLVITVPELSIVEVQSLDETERGNKGYGSSDKPKYKQQYQPQTK
jgi:dUTP pyrophosphatase